MIFFWDNGGSYSDHGIDFIDSGWLDPAAVHAFISSRPHWDDTESYVFAQAERVDWLGEGGVTPLDEWMHPQAYFHPNWGAKPGEPRDEVWDRTPAAVLDYLYERWLVRVPPSYGNREYESRFCAEYLRRKDAARG